MAGNIRNRIAGSLQGSSSRRLLVVCGIVIAGALVYFFFLRPAPPVTPSSIRTPATGTPTVQGAVPVSPQMDRELSTADQTRISQAETRGTSALPTIRINDTETIDLAPAPAPAAPEVIQRPPAPVIQRPTVTPTPLPPAPAPVAPPRLDDEPVLNLGATIGTLAQQSFPAASVAYYSEGLPPPAAPAPTQSAGGGATAAPASAIRLPMPGTILYAELISEANSDSPGPVLAQIVEGELAGAKLIGQFAVQRESLVITFNTLTMGTDRNGEEINETVGISAYAVDASNIGSGLASEVDYHLLQNIGITFASSFAQGFGQAIAQSGQQIVSTDSGTTIVNPTLSTQQQLMVAAGTAAGATGQTLNQLFGNRPITVKVKSGTGIGVLFLPSGRN